MILTYPSAQRNQAAILSALEPYLRPGMQALEIASGSGQHVEYFASAWPSVQWQPSEPASKPRQWVDARVAAAGLKNVSPALPLDVEASWPTAKFELVLCVNMVHISPWTATEALLRGAADVLDPGGVLFLYGPYKQDGRHTAPSNAAFDEDLRGRNALWGIRDMEAVFALGQTLGLVAQAPVSMPANNFCLVLRRDG